MTSVRVKPKTVDGLKFMEYLIGLKLTPSRKFVMALSNAYDSLLDLLKLQDRTSKKRFYEGIAEIIYPAVKQDEKGLKAFNEYLHGDKGFFGHVESVIEKKIENPGKYTNSHTFYIGDRLRSLSYRKRSLVNEMLVLSERHDNPYFFQNLHSCIQFLGEFYFLLNYCIKREEFFEHIDISRKEAFIQKLSLIGITLIQELNILEAQERIERERMGKSVDEELQVLDPPSESPSRPNYNLVTVDDILEALIINLPYHLSDNIEGEDVEFVSGQRYFLSKVYPQMLTFQSDEGNFSVSVFLKDVNDSYHVFSVHEEEGLAPEVIMETFEGTQSFTNFFSQLINQYELPTEINDEADEADGVMMSTINDVLKVLERLID